MGGHSLRFHSGYCSCFCFWCCCYRFMFLGGNRSKAFFLRNPTELGGARRVWAVKWKSSLAKNPTELGGARRVWALMCKQRMARKRLSAFPETTAWKQGARCCKRFAWRVRKALIRRRCIFPRLREWTPRRSAWCRSVSCYLVLLLRRGLGHWPSLAHICIVGQAGGKLDRVEDRSLHG